MTPYVANEDGGVMQQPDVRTPDSADLPPSRSTVSGSRSIIGNGRRGAPLKRVSFGSSKGSMVETLVYDHQDDLADLPPFLALAPLNDQGEESRLAPAKVRVQFIESRQPVAQVACAPPSPDVTLEFDAMTSPVSDQQSPEYHKQISHESGVDNPFRPDGELSREADTIVSLIKEGKPITPVKGEEPELDGMVANGFHHDQTDSAISPNGKEVQEVALAPNSTSPLGNKPKSGANGSTPKDQKVAPGVVEVQHSVIVPPSDGPAVEQVVIKKKPKCKCCVIQ